MQLSHARLTPSKARRHRVIRIGIDEPPRPEVVRFLALAGIIRGKLTEPRTFGPGALVRTFPLLALVAACARGIPLRRRIQEGVLRVALVETIRPQGDVP